jgi:hypothetical protein
MIVPVALFAYNRSHHLRRTLACLRADAVPLIYAFSDGPRAPENGPAVEEVRQILRAVDWCELRLVERMENLGLGRSVRTGVSEVLAQHDSLIVFEDDLICVPGTYAYLCAALEQYHGDTRVMSVTAWTHPRVTPGDVGAAPYFDGRAECWVWGTWARVWAGMDHTALELVRECEARGIDPRRYGDDLIAMAQTEIRRNIWAVRWLYHHIVRGGLCLRPPWSMVEHVGFDAAATNAVAQDGWANPPLRAPPPLPSVWPEPSEHPSLSQLWRQAYSGQPSIARRVARRTRALLANLARAMRRMLLAYGRSPQ